MSASSSPSTSTMRAEEYRPSVPTPPWIFHVATVSVAVGETAALWAGSTAMRSGEWRAHRTCTGAQNPSDQPYQRNDRGDDQREQRECRGRGVANRGERSIDENRGRDDAGCKSDDRSDQKIAPADMRG